MSMPSRRRPSPEAVALTCGRAGGRATEDRSGVPGNVTDGWADLDGRRSPAGGTPSRCTVSSKADRRTIGPSATRGIPFAIEGTIYGKDGG